MKEVPTRDRLHRAIYAGRQPPIHNGTIFWHKGTAPPGAIKDEWRFFINGIYNHNLARYLDLRPVLNTRWWTVGQRWSSKDSVISTLGLDQAGKLPLSTPLYRDYVSLEFAIGVRKSARFRDSISTLELARKGGQPRQVRKVLEEHIS